MISVTVTYDASIPYNAASIDVPTNNINELSLIHISEPTRPY